MANTQNGYRSSKEAGGLTKEVVQKESLVGLGQEIRGPV